MKIKEDRFKKTGLNERELSSLKNAIDKEAGTTITERVNNVVQDSKEDDKYITVGIAIETYLGVLYTHPIKRALKNKRLDKFYDLKSLKIKDFEDAREYIFYIHGYKF